MLSRVSSPYADREGPLLNRLLHFFGLSTRTWTASWKHTCGETARFRAGGEGFKGVLDWLSRDTKGMETTTQKGGGRRRRGALQSEGGPRGAVWPGGRLVCLGRGAGLYSLAAAPRPPLD